MDGWNTIGFIIKNNIFVVCLFVCVCILCGSERMPRSGDSSDGEDTIDLTKSLPASAFHSNSLPNSLGHSNGGIRRVNSDTLSDETDGNSLGTPRHLSRGNRQV